MPIMPRLNKNMYIPLTISENIPKFGKKKLKKSFLVLICIKKAVKFIEFYSRVTNISVMQLA